MDMVLVVMLIAIMVLYIYSFQKIMKDQNDTHKNL